MKKLLLNLYFVISIIAFNSVIGQIRSDFLLVDQGWGSDITYKNNILHVIWHGDGETELYYCQFDSMGYPIGDTRIIPTAGVIHNHQIAIEEDYAIIVWLSIIGDKSPSIYSIVFNIPEDSLYGEQEIVHGGLNRTSFSFIDDTTYIVIWIEKQPGSSISESGIYGQIATTSLNMIGSAILLNDDAPKDIKRDYPGVAGHSQSESFVVVWIDRKTTTQDEIYGRLFSKSGIPLNSTFLISESSDTCRIGKPCVFMKASGDFVVAWSEGKTYTRENVYIRPFHADGSPAGPVQKINDSPEVLIYTLDMANDKDDSFVVIWNQKIEANYLIFAQRFHADCSLLGGNFIVSDHFDTLSYYFPSVTLQNGRLYTSWDLHTWKWDIWANIIDFNDPPTQVYNNDNMNVPVICTLSQNYPNPFNSTTFFSFEIIRKLHVKVTIYNLLGEEIITIVDKEVKPGIYSCSWDSKDKKGGDVLSGIYFCQLKTERSVYTKKLLLVR